MTKTWKAIFHPETGSLFDWEGKAPPPKFEFREDERFIKTAIVMDADQLYYGTICLDFCFRGRSSMIFRVFNHDNPKQTFCIRLHEMNEMLKICVCITGKITGFWKVVKQGSNYSLRYVGQLAPKSDHSYITFSDIVNVSKREEILC